MRAASSLLKHAGDTPVELRGTSKDLEALHREVFSPAPGEGAAFLGVHPSHGRLLLHSYRAFGRDDFVDSGSGGFVLSEEAKVAALAAIKRAGLAAVEVHTHPGADKTVQFSGYDEEQLPVFAHYVQLKIPGRPFGALVFGQRSHAGRIWDQGAVSSLRVTAIGQSSSTPRWLEGEPNATFSGITSERFDRQVRALGPDGQRAISALRVGVIGLGGTGSQVVQQLAHLGVRDYVLVEDDRVEASNLPRLAGATRWDALLRRRKTSIARRTIRRLVPRARVRVTGPVRRYESLTALAQVDLIIGCVDNDGARFVLSELAAAHLVPYLDIGVGIEGEPGSRSIGGRLAFYLPGEACLVCADELDLAEVSEDLESEELRSIRVARGYANDRRIEPALMPLNTVLVGGAMMELLAFVTGIRPVVSFTRYDAVATRMIPQRVEHDEQCPVCATAFAMGDRQAIDRYAK
jgi:hypothetical protein